VQLDDTAIIAYAIHDAQEAEALCLLLTRAGYLTLRRRFSGTADDASVSSELNAGRCLIVLWSSNSAPLQRLKYAAERALRSGALIALQLDDCVNPLENAPVLDFRGWPQIAELAVCKLLLQSIETRLGRPVLRQSNDIAPSRPANHFNAAQQDATGRSAQFAFPAVSKKRRVNGAGGLAGGAAAVCLFSAVCFAAFSQGPDTPSLFSETNPMANLANAFGLVNAEAAGAPSPVATSEAAARGASSTRVLAEPLVVEDRTSGERETKDWLQVRSATDAEHAISMLSRYRAMYPGGKNATEAALLEADWRGLKHEAQAQLARLGYHVVESDNLLHASTRASIRSFQLAQGMAPDGRVDRALVFALRGAPAPASNPLVNSPPTP